MRPARYREAVSADPGYGVGATPSWRDIDWREHLRETAVAGRRVSYVDLGSGDGPPVVFVHGLGGSWQNWLENIPRVAQERRVVALDLPGFGRSEMPAERSSIPGYARVVDELCDRLGLGEVVVVGNSMGGFIAAELAIEFSARVAKCVLVAAAGISITSLRRHPAMTWARVVATLGAWGTAHARTVAVRPRLRHAALSVVMRHPSRIPADLAYEQIAHSGSPGFVDAMKALLSHDVRARLGEVRCPTLIVWGDRDVLVPVEDAAVFESLIADSRTLIFTDTGHTPMLERPVEFNDRLMEFVRGRAAMRESPGERGDAEQAATGLA